METKIDQNVKVDSNLNYFLKELYDIMHKYGIHRIYRAVNNKNEFSEIHQALEISINPNKIINREIVILLKEYLPLIYYRVIVNYKLHMYKRKLKNLMKKHEIQMISASAFSLYQGIYTSKRQLCINGVDIVYNSGKTSYIDTLYLDI